MEIPRKSHILPLMNAFDLPLIETPCVKICVLEPESGFCIGCGRSRDEISDWLVMTADQRRAVMDGLAQRVNTLTLRKRRRGGRQGRLTAS